MGRHLHANRSGGPRGATLGYDECGDAVEMGDTDYGPIGGCD